MCNSDNIDNRRKDAVVEGIRRVISELMDSVLNKVLISDPFIEEQHHAKKPLYAALVPDEIFKGSHFERRFVTPFGRVWERLAHIVATANWGKATVGASIEGVVAQGRLQRIQEVLNAEDHGVSGCGKRKPDWEEDLNYVLAGTGELIPVTVVADLLVEDVASDRKYAFELKAPLPNSDQTKVSKEKMLKLMAMEGQPVTDAFYALVYNPYGSRADYSWSFPKRWFDFTKDRSLLIGNEFWDFIGGPGTYTGFVSEINRLGHRYKEIIYRDYLKIEPVEGLFSDEGLK